VYKLVWILVYGLCTGVHESSVVALMDLALSCIGRSRQSCNRLLTPLPPFWDLTAGARHGYVRAQALLDSFQRVRENIPDGDGPWAIRRYVNRLPPS
jgi:hypothetical protein